eukprot:759390-Hanusia_phi.AAC.3
MPCCPSSSEPYRVSGPATGIRPCDRPPRPLRRLSPAGRAAWHRGRRGISTSPSHSDHTAIGRRRPRPPARPDVSMAR